MPSITFKKVYTAAVNAPYAPPLVVIVYVVAALAMFCAWVVMPNIWGLLVGQAGVENVRVAQANAPELLDNMLDENSVDELWVFFPDPWHKSRHHKRRLVSPAFADKVARVLKPGGIWRLATDWEEYAHVMRDVMEAHPDFENIHAGEGATEDDPVGGWAPRWEGRILTSFERKAREAGRRAHDLTYRRK